MLERVTVIHLFSLRRSSQSSDTCLLLIVSFAEASCIDRCIFPTLYLLQCRPVVAYESFIAVPNTSFVTVVLSTAWAVLLHQ